MFFKAPTFCPLHGPLGGSASEYSVYSLLGAELRTGSVEPALVYWGRDWGFPSCWYTTSWSRVAKPKTSLENKDCTLRCLRAGQVKWLCEAAGSHFMCLTELCFLSWSAPWAIWPDPMAVSENYFFEFWISKTLTFWLILHFSESGLVTCNFSRCLKLKDCNWFLRKGRIDI